MKHPVRVTPLQFFFYTVNIAFGVSMLMLPRQVAEIAKEDMWLSVLLACFLGIFSFWVAYKLASYYPGHTILEYTCLLAGQKLGQVLNVVLIVLMLLVLSHVLRIFVVAVKIYLLDLTPPQVIIAVMLLAVLHAVQYGLVPALRVLQVLFVPGYGLFTALIMLGVLTVDLKNYQPFLAEGWMPVLKGIIPAWIIYTGPEILVGFLYPYITRPQSLPAFGGAGITFLLLLYVMITLITQGVLGADETAQLLVPTVMAYRSVEIPDTFIERLDGYLMTIWIVICYNVTICWAYLVSLSIGLMLKLEYNRPISAFIMPLILYLSLMPVDFQMSEKFGNFTNYVSMAWSLGVLPLLLALAWLRKRRTTC